MTASGQSNCRAKVSRLGASPIGAAGVFRIIDACAAGKIVAHALEHAGQHQAMLAGAVDAESALLLIDAAGCHGVVAVEDLALLRLAQESLVRDLRSPPD